MNPNKLFYFVLIVIVAGLSAMAGAFTGGATVYNLMTSHLSAQCNHNRPFPYNCCFAGIGSGCHH